MAPKQEQKDKTLAVKKDNKQEKKKAPDDMARKADEKKAQSNMITTLKTGTQTPERKAFFEYYNALPRFSAEKKLLLEQWGKDKSCKWFSQYYEEKIKSNKVEETALQGFGTK